MSNTETVGTAGNSERERVDEQYRVLVVDDEADLAESCRNVLVNAGYRVTVATRANEALALLNRGVFDIALIDLYLPHMSGMELLKRVKETSPDTLVVVMTANPSVESSIEVLHEGAWDYLPKPFTASHLQVLLGRASHVVAEARKEGAEKAHQEKRHSHSATVSVLGRSAAFLEMVSLAKRVAATDASVFLTGESGSGKEVIAQYIHHHSRRQNRSMVAVNCAALPEALLESEMFGHVKGAFTGAIRDKPGLLKTADGGTFFLDELTEMSQPIQAKLLRVIQDGSVRRVGSESNDGKVDVRFIAATNRSPQEAVSDGVLRQDLFYRLSVVPIKVPALRERPDDITLLAEHFFSLYWKRHRQRGSPMPTLSEGALSFLQSREWPGNVRQLQNVMEHAVVLLEPGSTVRPDDLPYGADSGVWGTGSSGGPPPTEIEYHAAREKVLADFEIRYITRLIDRAGANMSQAAKIAGVDRTTLYRLMEKHGLERDTVITMS